MIKDNIDILIIVIVGTLGFLLLATFSLSFLIAYQKRYFHHQKELSEVKENYDKITLRSQLEIKEQILKNISQEIHDNLGQVFSLANLLLSSLEIKDNSVLQDKVENVMLLISKGINDLKDLSKSMDSDMLLKQGLTSAVKHELHLIEKTGKYKIVFILRGEEKKLDASKEIILYRIVQESLSNIIRHSHAKTIEINIFYAADKLNIHIIDDGIGFEQPSIKGINHSGAGIKNIMNRALMIGADLEINSTKGAGTHILLSKSF